MWGDKREWWLWLVCAALGWALPDGAWGLAECRDPRIWITTSNVVCYTGSNVGQYGYDCGRKWLSGKRCGPCTGSDCSHYWLNNGAGPGWVNLKAHIDGCNGRSDENAKRVMVAQVSFPDSISVCVGGIVPLAVPVIASAAATLLTYTSSDPAIASVSGSAPLLQVQGVATGVVSISAEADGHACVSVPVKVEGAVNQAPVLRLTVVDPSHPVADHEWGMVGVEGVKVKIGACRNGDNWCAVLLVLEGCYSYQARLLDGVAEVTGPGGNTTADNYCDQVTGLSVLLGNASAYGWYILSAVRAHEDVHQAHLAPALDAVAHSIEVLLEALCVAHATGMTPAQAISQITSSSSFDFSLAMAGAAFGNQYSELSEHDHDGATAAAERSAVTPMITAICRAATTNGWITTPLDCPYCP